LVNPIVVVLITAGLQVPMMPLFEVTARDGAIEFWHKVPIDVNTGVISVATVTSIVTIDPHCPGAGVKV
jgi:hypothetical protein